MGGIRKGIWIARDKDGTLWSYVGRPKKVIDPNAKVSQFVGRATTRLPSSWCKSIKFENSPVFIPLNEDFVKQFIKK